MNLNAVFSIVNALVLPQWLLMIFAPHWQWTRKLANTYLIPIILAITYAFYILVSLHELDFMAFSTLAGIKQLFTVEQSVLVGWIHYLCFDLVAGTWIFNDSLAKGINRWLVGVCLLFCFMLGPIGFLLYYIIRKFA
ncbi:ABA4-like family protein [Emticicia sp. 17c]|uniref:ABA4-like family protein n=1 Tax=Emticicia sp. 17c TaxID=3127704 RepID=UPI00301D2E61